MTKVPVDNVPRYATVKILLVEDLESDAELAKLEISRGLADWCDSLEFRKVDNRKDFLDAIENFKPDLIVSDYMMPLFNGMEVITLTLEHTPETPIVILTGSMNEETA
ncbi:MAG: response regulator, partial [Mesotoga sp.]